LATWNTPTPARARARPQGFADAHAATSTAWQAPRAAGIAARMA
jgi:hypothetical protein